MPAQEEVQGNNQEKIVVQLKRTGCSVMKTTRPGIKDIAAEAGVSVTTVSYIISDSPEQSFSAETKKKVHDAIRKLGYVPNMAARALVSNRSMMIGIVIPQTEQHKEFMFSNPFYGEFLSSVEYTARQNRYHVLISGRNADQTFIEVAQTRGLDGLIILGMYLDDHCAELKKSGIPIVLVDCYCDDDDFHSVQIDDRQGGYMATKHLLEKGHSKIAHVTGQLMGQGVNQQRMWGWRKALEEAGITYKKSLLYDGEVSFEHGEKTGLTIAKKIRKSGITAIFASADIIALGLYKGLKKGGVFIPNDISVVSFDDTWLANIYDNGLTVIRQDVALKGKTAVEIVLEMIQKGSLEKRKITLPITLVERGSVCRR